MKLNIINSFVFLLLVVYQIANAQVKTLVFGKPIENSISKGELHTYQIKLDSGGFLNVTVEQIGVDLVISVIDPDGKNIDEINSLTGNQSKKKVLIEAKTSGNYRLEIYPIENNGNEGISQSGNYKVQIEKLFSAEEYKSYLNKLKEDPRVVWLKNNSIEVRSISPHDEDFSDLQPLKKIIGDSRIVMLGEQTHGDGATFLAKTRLIKFLHQEMGFDVLAFESGLYDVGKAWTFLKNGENPVQAVRRGVFGIWTNTNELRPLIDYLGEKVYTDRPLELAGFDSQFTGSASKDFYIDDLKEFLSIKGIETLSLEDTSIFKTILQNMIESSYNIGNQSPIDSISKIIFLSTLKNIREKLELKNNTHYDKNTAFWIQNLKSLEGQAPVNWFTPGSNRKVLEKSIRDIQMGKNLIWLSREYYPNRKIIVWAATFHIIHNPNLINTRTESYSYENTITMGHHVWQNMGDEVYTLGFTAYEGHYGWLNWEPSRGVWNVPQDQTEELELEELMNLAGIENAVLDFRSISKDGFWLRDKLISRPLGNIAMEADWTKVLDGMFFTRRMTPVTRATR